MSADDLLVILASYVLFVLSVAWLVAMLLTMYIGVSHFMYLKKKMKERGKNSKKEGRKTDSHKIDL